MNQYRAKNNFLELEFPPVIRNILIINVLVHLLKSTLSQRFEIDLTELGGLYHPNSTFFRLWQPITHMFLHANFSHLFFNMFGLWMFGKVIERLMGPSKFLMYYICCGLGAAALQIGVMQFQYQKEIKNIPQTISTLPSQNVEIDKNAQYIQLKKYVDRATFDNPNNCMIGASGAVFGLLLAFGYLFPNVVIYLNFFIPMKAKWFVVLYGFLELSQGVYNSSGDNVAHFAHLGGLITGIILLYSWKLKSNKYIR